jgi:hypothetical protein
VLVKMAGHRRRFAFLRFQFWPQVLSPPCLA